MKSCEVSSISGDRIMVLGRQMANLKKVDLRAERKYIRRQMANLKKVDLSAERKYIY